MQEPKTTTHPRLKSTNDHLSGHLYLQINATLGYQISSHFNSKGGLYDQVNGRLYHQLGNQLRMQIGDRLFSQLHSK